MATCLIPKLAATCIKPESLLKNELHILITSITSSSFVLPIRLITLFFVSWSSDLPRSWSLADPSKITFQPLSIASIATFAKCSTGHLLASPYSAPGAMPKILSVFFNLSFKSFLAS